MIDSKSSHIQEEGLSITISRTPTDYTGKAIIGKIGKTLSDYSVQNKRMINCLLESNLTTGELVTCGDERFIIVVSRKEVIQGQEAAIIAYGLICNATLTVSRTTTTYDDDGNPTGETPLTIIDALACRADQINGKMRELDTGLLNTTVMKLTCPNDDGLLLNDKATVAGRDYRVDDIDRFGIPGAMVVQLSIWTAG
jgi:hypothetical protein